MRALIIIVVLALAGGRALAYPQFQLSKDQTCAGCHISPAGGGLLSENGTNTAEEISMLGTNPEFMYGKLGTPDWLQLGGDARGQWGYLQTPQKYLLFIPMQLDVYARATFGNFSVQVTPGMRPPEWDSSTGKYDWKTYGWVREAYVQWQQEAGSHEGLFVRAGRLMPVFGLRWVEHPLYVRRFGGTPLFSETWGASASYLKEKYEAHVSGFVEDPLIDPVRRGAGGAAYGELRMDEATSVGAGVMVDTAFSYTLRGELTVKRNFADLNLLVQGELQVVNPHVAAQGGGSYGHTELVSELMATYFAPKGIMVDVGWGHYDKNVRITQLDRDALDLDIHWFATSHIEAMLVNRLEFMQWGSGGPTGAYSMLQAHYRL